MKRQLTKLRLGRETLSILSQPYLGKARGGTGPTTGSENCFTGDWWAVSYCANTCYFDSDQPCP